MTDIITDNIDYNEINKTEKELRNLIIETFNYDFNIPITVKIIICAVIIVIISIITYLVSQGTNIYIIDQNYLWYYVLAGFNLLNIICILFYYQYKYKKLQTDSIPGPEGKIGEKGDRGKYISCSFCDSNIYIKRTKTYRLVLDLAKSAKLQSIMDKDIKILKELHNETYKSYQKIGMVFDNMDSDKIIRSIGIDGIESEIINGESNEINEQSKITIDDFQKIITMENINDLNATFMTLISFSLKAIMELGIDKINYIITKGQTEKPGSFFNVNGGETGYYSIGDSVFNGNASSRLNAFMINGDIRNPIGFTKRSQITTYSVGEYGQIVLDNYTVWKPTPPKGYVAMGDIIKKGINPPRPNLIACLNKDCVKDVGIKEFELVFISYDANVNISLDELDADELLNSINNANSRTQKQNDNYNKFSNIMFDEIIYSVWRTTMNTMYIKSVKDNDIITGTVIYNIFGDNTTYFDEYGQAKSETYKLVKDKLKSIKLNKTVYILFVRTYYLVFYYGKMKERINLFYESDYYGDLLNQIKDLKKKYNMKFINKDVYKRRTKEVNQLIVSKPLKIVQNNFSKKIKKIPQIVDNIENLYDLLEIIIPGGLDANIRIDNIVGVDYNSSLKIQIELLKLCKVLFPPNLPNYIIKNECIAFDKISLGRRKIINDLTEQVNEFKLRMKIYESNPEEYCGPEAWEGIVNYKEIFLFNYLEKYLGHLVKEPIKKILMLELDYFPDSRLKVIVDKFKEFNKFGEEQCKSIFDAIDNQEL